MATRPAPPEPPQGEADPQEGEPNTSHLPVEPEFAPQWQPAEPAQPVTHPHLP